MRFDQTQTTNSGTSGVTVKQGSGGVVGAQGADDSNGKSKRGSPEPSKSEGSGDDDRWQPKSELYIKTAPSVLRDPPKIECPAVRELGIEGVVKLAVQIRKDGTIRSIRVKKALGHGCDAIAKKALRKARFKPARANNGKAVDFEIPYEYEFRLSD